jgi:hypothetical protein
MSGPNPAQRLERALWRLESTLDSSARAGVGSLRAALAPALARGPLPKRFESRLIEELHAIELAGHDVHMALINLAERIQQGWKG